MSVRRDSARNRARLVEAAREVFAERGFEATLDDVAHHAGLGTGTAYRHFPNKRALAADRGLYEALTGRGDDAAQARIWPGIITAVTALFGRAQQAGVVRPDAAPRDIAAIFAFLGPVFSMSRTVAPDLWRRYLALMLDGLRATDRPPLPAPPPPLAALDTILKAGKT